jgi:hypothetical protein
MEAEPSQHHHPSIQIIEHRHQAASSSWSSLQSTILPSISFSYTKAAGTATTMKSFAILVLVSSVIAAPFVNTDGIAPRDAAKTKAEIEKLVNQAVSMIHDIDSKVQDAVKAGKSVDQIVPLITGVLGGDKDSINVGVTVSKNPSSQQIFGSLTTTQGGASVDLDLGPVTGLAGTLSDTIRGLTSLLGRGPVLCGVTGVGSGNILGGLGVGELGSVTGLLSSLLGSVSALLGTLTSVPGLLGGVGGGAIAGTLGGVLGGIPGLDLLPVAQIMGGKQN